MKSTRCYFSQPTVAYLILSLVCFSIRIPSVNGQNACESECIQEIYSRNCGGASCITGVGSSKEFENLCSPVCISAISGGGMLDCLLSLGGSIDSQNNFVFNVQSFCANGDPFVATILAVPPPADASLPLPPPPPPADDLTPPLDDAPAPPPADDLTPPLDDDLTPPLDDGFDSTPVVVLASAPAPEPNPEPPPIVISFPTSKSEPVDSALPSAEEPEEAEELLDFLFDDYR